VTGLTDAAWSKIAAPFKSKRWNPNPKYLTPEGFKEWEKKAPTMSEVGDAIATWSATIAMTGASGVTVWYNVRGPDYGRALRVIGFGTDYGRMAGNAQAKLAWAEGVSADKKHLMIQWAYQLAQRLVTEITGFDPRDHRTPEK
jgi:hypothetical protein